MKSKILVCLFVSHLSLTALGQTRVIFDDDFTSKSLSNYYVVPRNANSSNGAVIIDQESSPNNPFSGNALWLYDISQTGSTTITRTYSTNTNAPDIQLLEFNIALVNDNKSGQFTLVLSNAGADITNTNNGAFYIQFRMNKGTIVAYFNDKSEGWWYKLNKSGTKISIYTNSSQEDVSVMSFKNETIKLKPESFMIFTGDTLLGAFSFLNNGLFDSSKGIKLFGFTSTSTSSGENVIIDDIKIQALSALNP